MSNKSHEIGVYVEDIPMKLAERYRPIDFSLYIDQPIEIPDLFDQHYKFSAELYALEVSELRDKQNRKQISESMSKMDLKSNNKSKENKTAFEAQMSESGGHKTKNRTIRADTIHLTPGEILKPWPTVTTTKGTTRISDNYYNISDNSIDPNVNIKRKIVKDFESDTSSPFDYLELQTIDDMQELNDVFQAFHTKHTTNDSNCRTDGNVVNNSNNNNNNNCLNSCEPNASIANHMNGIIPFGAHSYQIADSAPVPAQCGQPVDVNHWVASSCEQNTNTSSDGLSNRYDSLVANNPFNPLADSQQYLLRSSKSASDLPTLLKSEDSSTVPAVRRQRSHTPPCSSSKTKTRKYINEKQTLVLNDPFEELSQYSKDFVISITSMGFDRSRVARAVKHIDNDHKKVIDFLLQVQTLEENGFDCCEAEIALHMNSYQILDAKRFLESLRQLSEVGFDKREIIKALVKCNNDRDRALDILLNSTDE